MSKKRKHDDHAERAQALEDEAAASADLARKLRPAPPAPVVEPTPRLEAYIREHDETPRDLATVRLEGGGSGDGEYLVDHPVPRIIGHNGSRYTISREEERATVYTWVNP
jgi:hypothetical protein